MNLHQNVIVEEYDLLAVYELRVLPTHGILLLNGTNMKVGDRFTQADVRSGVLQYKHTKNEGNVASAHDEFKYIIPLSDVANLKPDTPRSSCLPNASIPKDGLYTFPINIVCLPFPKEIRNKELRIMEDEYRCLNRNMLFYSSDTPQINAYFGKPAEPISPTENNIFNTWKRFSGNNVYENAGQDAPASSDAKRWEFNPENSSIRITNNSPSYTGMVNLTKSDSFKMKATLSSGVKDDDLIGLVIGYVEVGGIPQTLTAVRSGGFNGSGNTWFLMTTNGNARTIVAQKNMSAPNAYNNTKSQNWAELGKTQIEVTRKGNQIIAKTSQFSFMTSGVNNDALPIDESTTITYTIPSGSLFAEPAQYGFSALSQQLATFEDMEYVEIPPPVEPPVPDPPTDKMWERFPVTYTVTYLSNMAKATILLNGATMKVGDKFTHKDLDEGRVCVQGTFKGPATEYFGFTACVNEFKCTSGRFNIKVIEWPYPEVENNYAVMDECSEIVLTPDQLKYVVEFGSTDDQISIVLNPERTQTINQDKNKVEIIPASFTQADVNAGLVKLKHHCGDDPTLWTERLMFDVCTQKGKCRELSLLVKIIPLPIEYPPIDPGVSTSSAGCTYKLNFYGVWEPVGECGLWVKVLGRILPDPATLQPGQVVYVPNAPQGPVTLVVVDGKFTELPFNIPEQPTGECSAAEVAPATTKNKAVVVLDLWGDTDGRAPPKFAVLVGNTEVARGEVSDLKTVGQKGNQVFKYSFNQSLLNGSKEIKVKFLNDDWVGNDRNLIVNKIKVNGTYAKSFKRVDCGSTSSSSSSVKVMCQDGYASATEDWNGAPYTSSVLGACFTAPDGTKWVPDSVGEWRPVCDPAVPGSCNILQTDFTPIIKAVPDYILEQTQPNVLVPGKPIYHKPTDTVYTPQPDGTAVPDEQLYTESYALDEFAWIGPNEFWLPLNATFELFIFSSRFYVRYDIMNEYGQQTICQSNQQLWDMTSSSYGTPYFKTLMVSTSMSPYPITRAQKVFPMKTIYDAVGSNTNDTNPYIKGQYYVKLAGTNSYAGFVASQRPVGSPDKTTKAPTGNVTYKNPRDFIIGLDGGPVWSYSGFNDATAAGLKQYPGTGFNIPANEMIYGYLGAGYGKYSPWLHYESFKMYGNTYYKPTKKFLGWTNATLSFMNYSTVKSQYDSRNGGPINTKPPSTPTTYSFKIRGVDLVTGETKYRTYRVHWTATGKSATGATTATTDATVGIPGSFLPPKPKTAVCQYSTATGSIGNCYILEPPPDPTSPGGTGSPSSDYDDFFG
ncbi:hypothetical protein D3C72_194430 [compost metagenome]